MYPIRRQRQEAEAELKKAEAEGGRARAAQPACQARLQFFSIPFPYQYFCLLRDTSRVLSQLKGEFEQVSRKAVMFLCFLSIQNTSVVLTMRSPS